MDALDIITDNCNEDFGQYLKEPNNVSLVRLRDIDIKFKQYLKYIAALSTINKYDETKILFYRMFKTYNILMNIIFAGVFKNDELLKSVLDDNKLLSYITHYNNFYYHGFKTTFNIIDVFLKHDINCATYIIHNKYTLTGVKHAVENKNINNLQYICNSRKMQLINEFSENLITSITEYANIINPHKDTVILHKSYIMSIDDPKIQQYLIVNYAYPIVI